jgi:hypothetical protein
MAFFTDIAEHLSVLRSTCGSEDVPSERLPEVVARLGDDDVVRIIAQASELVRAGERLRIAAVGVAAARSTREQGHSGLAQSHGHRSPVTLLQELSGSTRADAAKQVRLGESLMATLPAADSGQTEPDANPRVPTPPAGTGAGSDVPVAGALAPLLVEPWHAPRGRALLAGSLSSAQHDAILRGLGEPPQNDGTTPVGGDAQHDASALREAWSLAAEQLIGEALERTVEELLRSARTVRDILDPTGAQRRFDGRFAARSFGMWVDGDGAHRASISFDARWRRGCARSSTPHCVRAAVGPASSIQRRSSVPRN